jgi:acetoacetate decarboxylase
MALDTFLDRPVVGLVTSAGEVRLPLLYEDGTALLSFFHVEHDRAAEVLAGTSLAPVRFARGTAIAAVIACEHRVTSVGPHRELGTALAVVPRTVRAPMLPLLHMLRAPARDDIGWHFVDFPVTTSIAQVAGREVWDLPRFTTEIDLDLDHDELVAVVQAPLGEEPIAILSGRAGIEVTLDARNMVLYTSNARGLQRVLLEARGPMHTGFGRTFSLRVGRVDHPMANHLFALGLDGARPFAVQVCRDYRAVLNGAAAVAAPSRAA